MLSPQDIEREMHVHRTLAERDEIILNLAKENEGFKSQAEKVAEVIAQKDEMIKSLTEQIAELKLASQEIKPVQE